MPINDNDEEESGKRICHRCIGESYLAAEVQASGTTGQCDYCGETGPLLTIEELADEIERAFSDHYVRTADQPDTWQERMMADRESSYMWEREGAPVVEAIQDAAGIDEGPAGDVLEILQERHGDVEAAAMGEESDFDSHAYYEEKGPDNQAWHEEWNNFEHALKTDARFFSRTAAELLGSVFGGIDQLTTRDGRPLVVAAGPGTALAHLHRARVFQAEDQLKEALCRPDVHLGSPPARAARAGRMNAQGIAVFYGATNAEVAIAEVRPPVGSTVALAKFAIIRPLRVLDLTALEEAHDAGSIFDPTLKRRLERVGFLQTLGSKMARPVMPDDEALEYLPTQAAADFLATMNEPRLDGIIFPSAQTKEGRNVVLFHQAARVASIELPEGSKVEAGTGYGTDEGWEVSYSVHERVRPPAPPPADDGTTDLPLFGRAFADSPRWDKDFRQPTLQVDVESVEVHHVAWVAVKTTRFSVHRYRSEQREPKY